MSNYTKSTNFASKDNLSSGNPLKIVKGTEIDTEFNNIATAIATKLDSASTTGSGNIVLANSPTLVTPALGTPSALVGTNITGTAAAFNIGGTATTATNLAGGANGTIPYQSASGTTAMLAAGNAGQFLQSQGSAAPTWVTTVATATIPRSARTSNTILGASDASTLVVITSGTFTQTFTAAATLGSGWFCYIQNLGTGDITLDPNGSETIDGLTSYIMYPNEVRLVQCDGTSFNTIVLNAFTRSYSSTSTFTKPPGYSQIYAECWGAGGGGGSGGFRAAGACNNGGGGGGGYMFRHILASSLSSSTTVTIGAGGTGGAGVGTIGQSPDENEGQSGTAGGNTTFSTCTANGGGNGSGGSGGATGFTYGGNGGGYGSANVYSTNTNYAFGGGYAFTQSGGSPIAAFAYAIYGGGGGGGSYATSQYSGASSLFGGSGGGVSGGTAGSVKNGGNGGNATTTGTSQAGGAGGAGYCTLRGVV